VPPNREKRKKSRGLNWGGKKSLSWGKLKPKEGLKAIPEKGGEVRGNIGKKTKNAGDNKSHRKLVPLP